MSGIAEVLLTLGYSSGSDVKPSTSRTLRISARPFRRSQGFERGWRARLVTSSAVKQDNPEVVEAHKCKDFAGDSRAEMLAELMRLIWNCCCRRARQKRRQLRWSLGTGGSPSRPQFVVGGRVNQAARRRLGKG